MNPSAETGGEVGAGGVLAAYARLKLSLADIVHGLLRLGEAGHNEATVQACRSLLGRLADDRFNLAIMGQYSRGKSSLMNALLGADKLPTGALPLTSVVTTVAYGERERVLLQRQGWSVPQEITLAQLPEFITQAGNPGNEKQVTLAELQLPSEILRLGVHFIDTPGIASAAAGNTRATRQFLPQVDAAILVTSFESPMSAAEVHFLGEVLEHARTVFVVVNKQDLVEAAERGQVCEALRAMLRDTFPEAALEVFAVSARDALRAKLTPSAEGLAASGLPRLEAELAQYLRRDKARELLLRAAGRAAGIARQHGLGLEIARRGRSPGEAALIRWRLDDRLAALAREREALLNRLRARQRVAFPEAVASRLSVWDESSGVRLAAAVGAELMRATSALAVPAWEGLLQGVFTRQFQEWLEPHREAIAAAFQAGVQPETAALDQLTAKIAAVPADVLGETSGKATGGPEPAVPARLAEPLTFRELDLGAAASRAPWWYDSLPPGRVRAAFCRRWLRRLPEFAQRYQAAVAAVLADAAENWIESLSRELARQIAAVGAQVNGLLDQPPGAGEESGVERILARLGEFSEAVAHLGGTAEGSAPALADPGAGLPLALPPCSICLRVERALMDYMTERQYQLSANEEEQRRHAAHSGFCPLHTWQYEAVASPQGICAAYPELLGELAARLRRLTRDAAAVAALEDGVEALLARPGTCPACGLAAATEATAAREFVANARERKNSGRDAEAGLCLPHLRGVLAAATEAGVAAGWVGQAADALERMAEDMRGYVMKHDAVRRQLFTGAERQAALAGLARLVGRRGVVAPWRVE